MGDLGVGRAVFAATLIALGLLGLVQGDFGAIWQPVPQGFPAREALAYVCALISLACGAGLLWRHTRIWAARVLLAYLFVWWLLFKVSVIVRAPAVPVSWESAAETAVILAAAWVLCASASGLRGARALYGLALIAFGVSHFAYLKDTAALVPSWLPWHTAWAFLTGCTYLAAGAAVLSGIWAPLAAALSAGQMALFTLLVWVLMLASGSRGAAQWSETIISWTLTVAAWVVAESYRQTDRLHQR